MKIKKIKKTLENLSLKYETDGKAIIVLHNNRHICTIKMVNGGYEVDVAHYPEPRQIAFVRDNLVDGFLGAIKNMAEQIKE